MLEVYGQVKEKLLYLSRSIKNFGRKKVCPNCQGLTFSVIDRKYFFTSLEKCDTCKLNVRFPLDDKTFLQQYYQESYAPSYSEETLSIAELPSDAELLRMMSENFHEKRNHAPFVEAVLKSTKGKVLDFGCSWGYSVFHLKQAGYDAEGFEIAKPRAEFGRKIGVHIHYQLHTIGHDLDLVMSNHTIEHLPIISEFVSLSASRLKRDGIFLAFCPNGSPEYRIREPKIFHVNWGFLHPNYLDIQFAATLFKNNPYLILTGDWNYDLNLLSAWDGNSQQIGHLRSGKELMIIAKPNIFI